MSIHSIIEAGTTFHQRCWRSKRIQDFMKHDLRIDVPSITREQKKLVDEIWKGIRVDYKWFTFFNLFNEEGRPWTPLYIPSNLYYSIVDMYYTDYKACTTIEDKNLNSLFFYDVKQPVTVVRNIGGNFLNENYENLTKEEVHRKLSPSCSYIVKPSIGSGGGRSIMVYSVDGNVTFNDFINRVDSFKNCVVQEFATQHEQLSSIYPESLNTVRIMTFHHDGKAKALSTIMRMGVGGGKIDNASAGGIFVGVDKDGRLKNVAYNDYGERFDSHPTSGAHYEDHHIPGYEHLVQLAERLHNRLYNFSKLISWDFAIDAEGDPILIEKNASLGGVSFHQMCNGPLFADRTKDVIAEVFDKKARMLSKVL